MIQCLSKIDEFKFLLQSDLGIGMDKSNLLGRNQVDFPAHNMECHDTQ